jgi:GLPGLI family protein
MQRAKNKVFALLFFLALAFIANAQQAEKETIVPAWKITYHLDFGPLQPAAASSKEAEEQLVMMEMARSLSGSSSEAPPLTCYVNPDYIRVEQNGLGGGITIADKRDTVSFLLDSASKTATKFPAAMPNLQTQSNGDSVVFISSDDFKIELLKDTMTIAGQHCRKAIFVNPAHPENIITVWYAPGLPRLYWQKYSYLKSVPGCTLSIGTVTKGLNVGIKADKVQKVSLSESFFQPPANYTISDSLF